MNTTTPGTLYLARRLTSEAGTITVEDGTVTIRWEAGGTSSYRAQDTTDALAIAHEMGRVDAHRRATAA